MNELLFFISFVICAFTLFFCYKFLGKRGLYGYIALASMLGFITSFRIAPISKFNTLISIPIYISIFIAIYVLIEKENKKAVYTGVNLAFATSVLFAGLLLILIYYVPLVTNILSIDITTVFQERLRLVAIYPIVLYGSLSASVYFYNLLKRNYKSMFISAILTCVLIQLLDTLVLVGVGYVAIMTSKELVQLIMVSYAFKLMISILYIPVLYMTNRVKRVEA
ncbi:MAG: VUT family protein [bacterium]|nr:VUT family protein [bacterium]